MRSMITIKNVAAADLNNYSPAEYSARPNGDGTYDLIPLRWTNQAEFMECAFGTGNDFYDS